MLRRFLPLMQNLAETIEILLIKESFRSFGMDRGHPHTSRGFNFKFTDIAIVETPQLTNDPIYARKEGMVVRFDVQHGEKKVKINEIVHPGDLLIDNELKDAFECLSRSMSRVRFMVTRGTPWKARC